MENERTFVMVKPDGVQRGLIGEVISRFERRGLKIIGMKMIWMDKDLARSHYQEHLGKNFFNPLISYITSGPLVAMVLEGKEAIKVVRNMLGKTNPVKAGPGTVRGDLGMSTGRNVVHGSDSPTSAEREISLFFQDDELYNYKRADEEWLYEGKKGI